MRRRLATDRDTLQEHLLPKEAQETELDYRTCITTDWQDTLTVVRLVSMLTLVSLGAGFAVRILTLLPESFGFGLLAVGFLFGLVYRYVRFLSQQSVEFSGVLFTLAGVVLFGLATLAPTALWAYLVLFGAAVGATAGLAHLITKQMCFFMAANERMNRFVVRRWKRHWWFIGWGFTPRKCPEAHLYRLGFRDLALSFLAGFLVLVGASAAELKPCAPLLAVGGFMLALPTFWLVANERGLARPLGPVRALRVTWFALRKFVCYNRHDTRAAGVFRFPTPLLRHPTVREFALGASLVLLTTALVSLGTASVDWSWNPPSLTDYVAGSVEREPTPDEKLFASQLPEKERARYLASKRDMTAWTAGATGAGLNDAGWSVVATLVRVAFFLLLCWLLPFALFLEIVWFVGGRLLTAYYDALEAPDAYELPYQPTKRELEAGIPEVTPWDNRIERLMWSKNELERRHFYLGTSLERDYPILLHEELLHTHAHILGDTGSGKTALGIAPLITQLIAREDCSVLILDLKGDPALFATTQAEAKAAQAPFRWFTNITGRSSFIFNPLKQSHLAKLSTNQLTQGILQALSLEYGQDYGRGHFSALNEIVSKAYLRNHGTQVRSFKELHRFTSDQDAFRNIGDPDDWKQTRQLINTIEKLGDVLPMNVVDDEDARYGPKVVASQIDMPDLLRRKQVAYFYLSSTLEPTTAAAVAKLAMFSLLSAAERRGPGAKNRVFVFIDEFQRVITENVKIFFQQARSKRLHFILANQAIGQLEANGVNLTDEVESDTSFKMSFRATDEKSIKRLIDASGEGLYHSMQWTQLVNDAFDERDDDYLSLSAARTQAPDGQASVKVTETVGPRLERNTVIEVSARPLAAFVRFAQGQGFTQFSGYQTTVLSEYHISKTLYGIRDSTAWPAVDERTVLVTADDGPPPLARKFLEKNAPIPKPKDVPAGFDDDLEKRLQAAAADFAIKTAGPTGAPATTGPAAANGASANESRQEIPIDSSPPEEQP